MIENIHTPHLSVPAIIEFTPIVAGWEVLATALISVLTIIASVLLARWIAHVEVARADRKETIARRARVVREFTDLATETLSVAEGHNLRVGRFAQFIARVGPDLEGDEERSAEWMRGAILNIQSDIDFMEPNPAMKGSMRLTVVSAQLMGWPRWEGTWAKFAVMMKLPPATLPEPLGLFGRNDKQDE